MIEFFQTHMGRKFYESDVPALVKAINNLAAAMAPPVPDWFVHRPPDRPKAPPAWYDVAKNEEDKKLLQAWVNDGIFDLPPEYAEWQDAMNEHYYAMARWENENKAERYFQWIGHFTMEIRKMNGGVRLEGPAEPESLNKTV